MVKFRKHTYLNLLSKTVISLLFITALNLSITAASAPPTEWIQGTNIYEVFVRSFSPEKNLNGVTKHLQDLKNMGVETVWLMPIFASPSPHGYDVTDYKDINPDYGTIGDLKKLVEKAHSLGMKVILDLPINHCSNQNPLFSSPDKNIRKDNWFMWKDSDQGWPGPWDASWDFCAGATWFEDTTNLNRGYYYGAFHYSMPDLDFYGSAKNEVVDYFTSVMKFWIDECSVDGFRCDAARYIVETGKNVPGNERQRDQKQTHETWQQLKKNLGKIKPEAILIAESPTENSDQLLSYYGDANEFNSAFHFGLQGKLMGSANHGWRDQWLFAELYSIQSNLPSHKKSNPQDWTQDTVFLSNHDEFAGARVATQLGSDIDKMKMAASLYLLLSGAPVIYYGEEIGMTNDFSKQGDDQIRGMLDWSEYKKQLADDKSLLNHYSKLLNLRNNNEALKKGATYFVHTGYRYDPSEKGDYTWDSSQNDKAPVMSIIREYNGKKILVVHNLAGKWYTNEGWCYLSVDLSKSCGLNIKLGTELTPIMLQKQDDPKTFPSVSEENINNYPVGWFAPMSTKVFIIGDAK